MIFFQNRSLLLKTERGKRVFPVTDSSDDVLKTLTDFLQENNVEVLLNSRVTKIVHQGNQITKVILSDNQEIYANNYIITTGGLSYPTTGSNGDGYNWAQKMGHKIIDPKPALTPVLVKEAWIKEMQGISLKNVTISVYSQNKKKDYRFGEALFTHEGLSGPIILDMSKDIDVLLKKGEVKFYIDFKPSLNYKKLDVRILRDFNENLNKQFKK